MTTTKTNHHALDALHATPTALLAARADAQTAALQLAGAREARANELAEKITDAKRLTRVFNQRTSAGMSTEVE